MNIYKKYLIEIQQRKDKGLQPKPIDDRSLLIQIGKLFNRSSLTESIVSHFGKYRS